MNMFTRMHHFHTSLLTTVLLSLAVIIFSAAPIGPSLDQTGFTFHKHALAGERGDGAARDRQGPDHDRERGHPGVEHGKTVGHLASLPGRLNAAHASPVARAHASVKSIVGGLEDFEQSVFASFANTTLSGELDLAIAELERQIETADVADAERAVIAADLAQARRQSDALIEANGEYLTRASDPRERPAFRNGYGEIAMVLGAYTRMASGRGGPLR